MKLTGYIFAPKTYVLGSGIFTKVATYSTHSNYVDVDVYELDKLKIWVNPIQLWFIKRYLNKFTNLEYTLETLKEDNKNEN